jgi:hypothetical protein
LKKEYFDVTFIIVVLTVALIYKSGFLYLTTKDLPVSLDWYETKALSAVHKLFNNIAIAISQNEYHGSYYKNNKGKK